MRLRSFSTMLAFALTLAAAGCAGGMMGGPMHGSGMGADMGGGSDRGMMMAMGPMVGCPHQHQDADAFLSRTHASLNITAAQEAAWAVYAAAYRRHAGEMGMGAMRRQMGSVPDRVRHHSDMMERHLASMRALRDSLDALYAVLTPEQRAAADALGCEPGQDHRH